MGLILCSADEIKGNWCYLVCQIGMWSGELVVEKEGLVYEVWENRGEVFLFVFLAEKRMLVCWIAINCLF